MTAIQGAQMETLHWTIVGGLYSTPPPCKALEGLALLACQPASLLLTISLVASTSQGYTDERKRYIVWLLAMATVHLGGRDGQEAGASKNLR